LHKALTSSGKVGVAKVAIQKREYLAAVKPDGLFLILELMHFAQEVLEPSSLNSGADRSVSPQELKMATALIDAMTAEWDPTKYQDQYQTALMQLIEEKAQKRAPAAKPAAPRVQPNVIDMVAVLQESLQRASVNTKASNGRSASAKSTSSLVKRRRRSVAA
jgi:DNA end-binding protein Ku